MWKYKVGFSLKEASRVLGEEITDEKIQNLLAQHHFEYTLETPRVVFERLVKEVEGAGYKNPSIMQKDAPNFFSCSSLVSYFSTMAGMPWMPSITVDKYVYLKPVKKEDLQYGDLVFSNSNNGKVHYESIEWRRGTKVPSGVDHVGIYLGDNKVIHSSRYNEKGTEIQDMNDSPSFGNTIVGFRRIADIDTPRYCVIVPDEQPELFQANSLLKYLAHAPKDTDIAFINNIPYISQLTDIPDIYWTNRSCGGVCLLMAFDFLGVKIDDPIKFLYEAEAEGHYKQTYGWYHQGLVDIAIKAGLNSYRTEGGNVDDLVKEIEAGNVPILSVVKRLFGTKRNHLVVATGFSKNKEGKVVGIYINDPERLYHPKEPQYVDSRLLDIDWTHRYIVIKKNA